MVLRASSGDDGHQAAGADDPEQRVLDAASRLFYERGIQAVGMDAIRDASGVSLKRIYRLFPAKEQLVAATLHAREQTALDELTRAGAGARDDTPQARILAVFDMLGEWFAAPDYRGCAFINAYGELGAGSPAVAETVERHKSAWRDRFATLVAEAGGPPQLADQLAILVNGAMVTAAVLGTPTAALDARAAAQQLLEGAGLGGTASRRGTAS